jgi:hypothetical protein
MNNYKNFRINLLAMLGAGAMLSLLLTSCLKDNNSNTMVQTTALLSFVDASPDEPPFDFNLDNARVNQDTLSFGDNINYFNATIGQRTVSFTNHANGSKILTGTVTLNQNGVYTLFLAGKAASPEIVLLNDTVTKPSSGFASVRFVNMSPDAPAVSMAVQGSQVLATNVSYKGYTTFLPLQGNSTVTFEFRQGTTNTVLATLPNIKLISGYVYTVYFRGLVASTNNTDKLSAGIVLNAFFNN